VNWAVILVFGIAGAVLITSAAFAGFTPAFWYGMGKLVWADLWPFIQSEVLKRNPPAIERQMKECSVRGGTWDNARKRCRY
jgi:hypothetical protein